MLRAKLLLACAVAIFIVAEGDVIREVHNSLQQENANSGEVLSDEGFLPGARWNVELRLRHSASKRDAHDDEGPLMVSMYGNDPQRFLRVKSSEDGDEDEEDEHWKNESEPLDSLYTSPDDHDTDMGSGDGINTEESHDGDTGMMVIEPTDINEESDVMHKINWAQLDLTCFTRGIYRAPDFPSAIVLQYTRLENPNPPHNTYVAAIYRCRDNYVPERLSHEASASPEDNLRLYCSEGRWVGPGPRCVLKGTQETSNELPSSVASPCAQTPNRCQHICKDDAGIATCMCYKGYSLGTDGATCQDIDECREKNGGCEGQCINTLGSYRCECIDGYRLASNGWKCEDRNECLLRNGHGPCQDTCTNFPGSYLCSCDGLPGTRLASDAHTCEDEDECAQDNFGCSHLCLNTLGAAFCACPNGFELQDDWKTCHDVDECSVPEIAPSCELGCRNTIGSYRCLTLEDLATSSTSTTSTPTTMSRNIESPPTFRPSSTAMVPLSPAILMATTIQPPTTEVGTTTTYKTARPSTKPPIIIASTTAITLPPCGKGYKLDGNNCVDINECATINPCLRGYCLNLEGGFRCGCGFGYKLVNGTACDDVNECEDTSLCKGGTCVNLDGTFECQCDPGYRPGSKGQVCVDVDECWEEPTFCVPGYCSNTVGSFRCECATGYHLIGDSKCLDIDECELYNGNCQQKCINSEGSFKCACNDGYTLQADGSTCQENVKPEKPKEVGVCSPSLIPQHGDLVCSSNPINGHYVKNTICELHCKNGFVLEGRATQRCHGSGIWRGRLGSCVGFPKPHIRCPQDMTVQLPHDSNKAYVVIPQPETNVDWWRQVEASPSWSKALEGEVPVGVTLVTFRAHHPILNSSASCSFLIKVKDLQPPRVSECPESTKVRLPEGSDTAQVTWEEPTFRDNIEVVRVVKSHSPGDKFTMGRHVVTYVAFDAEENSVRCAFKVTVTPKRRPEPEQVVPKSGKNSLEEQSEDSGAASGAAAAPPVWPASASQTAEAVESGPDACPPLTPPPHAAFTCYSWVWGRLCKLACKPGFTFYRPLPSAYYMCGRRRKLWTPNKPPPLCTPVQPVSPTGCMPGWEKHPANPPVCAACPPGMYRPRTSPTCFPCPMGSFQHRYGRPSCRKCPDGFWTLGKGSRSRTDCISRPLSTNRTRRRRQHWRSSNRIFWSQRQRHKIRGVAN